MSNISSIPDADVRACIARAMAASGLSREQIADRMTAQLGRKVSPNILNHCAAPSKDNYRFPLSWVPAFCDATGDDELMLLTLADKYRNLIRFAEAQIALERARQDVLAGGAR